LAEKHKETSIGLSFRLAAGNASLIGGLTGQSPLKTETLLPLSKGQPFLLTQKIENPTARRPAMRAAGAATKAAADTVAHHQAGPGGR
jgi:hypothetical protein